MSAFLNFLYISRFFNVLTHSLYSVRCLTILVLLSFVLKLTTQIGGFDEINKKRLVPCLILLIYLDQKPVIKSLHGLIYCYNYTSLNNWGEPERAPHLLCKILHIYYGTYARYNYELHFNVTCTEFPTS